MNLLFFDTEHADTVKTIKICSLGYVKTDINFNILDKKDILIHPKAEWNSYVLENILYYKKEDFERQLDFKAYYEEIKNLFKDTIAIGCDTSNDVRAIKDECVRYDLEPIQMNTKDIQVLCKKLDKFCCERPALAKLAEAYHTQLPGDKHTSLQDAIVTMEVFKAMCKKYKCDPIQLLSEN